MAVFFIEGNKWFMGILTLLFLSILTLTVISGIYAFKARIDKLNNLLRYIKSIALFTLVTALFFQILSFVNIYSYLSDSDIKTASGVMVNAIKITFHSTIYGVIIFLISYLIYLGFRFRIKSIK